MRIFNVDETTNFSSFNFVGTIRRGFTTIEHRAGFVATLSAEEGVIALIESALKASLDQLYANALRQLSQYRLSRVANRIVGTELDFSITVQIGDLHIVARGGLVEGPPLNTLSLVLDGLTATFSSRLFEGINRGNAENGFVWDDARQGYVQRSRTVTRRPDIADRLALDLERMFGGNVTIIRPGDLLDELETLIADDLKNVPWGYYPCGNCLNFHPLEPNTYWDAASQEVLPIPRGKYPTRDGGLDYIPDGWFWSNSARALAETPEDTYVEDGEVKRLPPGTEYDYLQKRLFATDPYQYYDEETGAVAKIPEGKYLHDDGDLDDIPPGTIFDFKLKRLVATEHGKYWDVVEEELIDVPPDSYINPDGDLIPRPPHTVFNFDKNRLVSTLVGHYFNPHAYEVQPIPDGYYVTEDGELDSLADGNYPDADGNLHEVPPGQRWNTKTGDLEPDISA